MISLSLSKIWKQNQNSGGGGNHYRNPKQHIIERLSGKKKRPKNALSKVPDEILVYIFRYLSAQELAKGVALTSKRTGYLWLLAVQNFRISGKIRKFKEEPVISVIKKFVRLESLDVNNNGSSGDFQLTDKGFLQLAHKYIYSDADTINREIDSLREDPLSGEFDFNFDYETHLDSTFDTMSAIDPDMDSEDEFDDETTETSMLGSRRIKKKLKIIEEKKKEEEMKKFITKEELIQKYPIEIPEDEKKEEDTNTETSEDAGYYNSLKHIYYYYPPPSRSKSNQQEDHKEPCYGLRTLKSLNVTGCHSLTEKGVNYMTYICQNLEHLNLKGCNKINDKACSFLSEFNKLETLNLTGCTRITDEGIEFLSKMKSKNLQLLDLTFCFKKGTLVKMSNGSHKSIEEIKVGESVLGPDSKPRKVISLTNGRDVMYKITERTKHRNDENYGILTFICNSNHLLVVSTQRWFNKVIEGENIRVYYFNLEKMVTDDRIIQMVKSHSIIFYNDCKHTAKEKVDLFIQKKKKEDGIYPIKWLIMAKDVKLMDSKVRNATKQYYAPILLENTDFREKCRIVQIGKYPNIKTDEEEDEIESDEEELKYIFSKKFPSVECDEPFEEVSNITELEDIVLTKNNIGKESSIEDKAAYLFGLWIGDGQSNCTKIYVDTRDTDEHDRIIEFSKSLGLKASNLKKYSSEQSFNGVITINSPIPFGNSGKYHLTKYNCLWNLIRKYIPESEIVKTVPRQLANQELSIREWFMAGLIDSDGHVNKINDSNSYGYQNVKITTIYEGVRDGVIELARSLGIKISVTLYPEKFINNVKHQKSYAISLTPCSVLSNILSKCSIKRKQVKKPEKVTYQNQHFSFDIDIIQKEVNKEFQDEIEQCKKKQKLEESHLKIIENLNDIDVKILMNNHKHLWKNYTNLASLSKETKYEITSSKVSRFLQEENRNSKNSRTLLNEFIAKNFLEFEKDIKKLNFNEINILKFDNIQKWTDFDIKRIMNKYKRFGLNTCKEYNAIDSMDNRTFNDYLSNRTIKSKARNICEVIIKDNFHKINQDDLIPKKLIDTTDDYFGFTLEYKGNESDRLFMLSNNIVVHNCHQITDEGLKHISNIKSLTSLDLTCCRKITPKGLQYLIDNCSNLISLNLTGCDQIYLSPLKMKPKSKIEKLQLMGCKSTSDECMRKISYWAPNLNDLNIAYSDHVTDAGIDLIITNCPNIKSLNIKRCLKITDHILKCLAKKENITHLNVTGCKNITNKGIEYISTMKNLQELGLRRCNLITDDGVSFLSSLKNLENLDLSECNLITKASIKALCDEISERKLTVDLRNSTLPSSEFLSKLVPKSSNSKESTQKGLRILKLENNVNMSKEFVDQLQHHYRLQVYYAQDGTL